jgi:hypothetical protein|tara:strand:- start:620 stop:1621 length:1002 start_codon:yes stop_codon:yes gene_type:complete
MGFQTVEYSLPHEQEETKVEIEDNGSVEIDITGKKEAEEYKKEAKPKEKEIEVEVVDDTPKADRNRKASAPPEEVTEEELEDYSEKVRKRIQHFSKGYHDERRAKEQAHREREELETFAKTLVDENNKLKGTVDKNQAALLEQAKKTASGEMLLAKRQYKRAYEDGNADKLLEAQEKLTTAKIKADKLDNFVAEPLQSEEVPVQMPQEARQKPDAKASDWANENSWFGSDDEMTAYAMGVHSKLVKQGVDTTSDDYYEAIDARMRNTFPDEFGETEEQEVKTTKRQSNVVAPATRSTAPKKVRLTQTQVAIAKKLGVPLELYAQKVAEEMRKI